jgi:hypothetical protein
MTGYAIVEMHGLRAAVLLHSLPEESPELAEALARRNIVNTGGQCPCGARTVLPNRAERRRLARQHGPAVRHVAVWHEPECPASDERIAELQRWSR